MGVIARYREHLPIAPATPEEDLSQGPTPLGPSQNLGPAPGLNLLYSTYQGLTPTGPFNDPAMAGACRIVDGMGDAGDCLMLPVGNGGSIAGYWKGFREDHAAGRSSRLPRMVGAQAEGAAPIVTGAPVPNPKTGASAIRIGNPASWEGATSARDESGGMIAAVTDTEILAAQIRLASSEGLFAEPASAAPLALLFRLVRDRKIERDSTTVVVLTGSGLKDPDAALKNVEPPIELDGDARTLAKVLKL